jgi:acetyltransferase
VEYEWDFTMKNGEEVQIRPIRPEDEPMLVKFHETLSDRTVYQRYLQMLKLSQRVAHERLTRICFIDYARHMALVAERRSPATGEREVVAVGRLNGLINPEAEFAIVVADAYQKQGLGGELLRLLIDIGKKEGVEAIVADVLAENSGMLKTAQRLGFKLDREIGDPTVSARLELKAPATV